MAKSSEGRPEGPSLASVAKDGADRIMEFAESDDGRDQLIGMNSVLFAIVAGFTFTAFLYEGKSLYDLQFAFYLIISMFVGFIVAYPYTYIVEITSQLSNQLNGLRASIVLLSIAFTTALAGLLLNIPIFNKAAMALILIQIVIPMAGDIIPIFGGKPLQQSDNGGFWTVIDRTSAIITIATFVVDILLLLFV